MRYTLPNLILGIIIADIIFFSVLKTKFGQGIHPLFLILASAIITLPILAGFYALLNKVRKDRE